MEFSKKPIVIEATQWFANGDHPEDNCNEIKDGSGEPITGLITEGKVVRYYRSPGDDAGQVRCTHCDDLMSVHGWIDTLEGGHIVCPGDWIITGIKGERYPCKPDIFEATYERV